MSVKFFSKTYPITIVIIVIVAIISQLPCIIYPDKFFISDNYSPVINLLRSLYNISPIISSAILFICYFVSILIIHKISTDNLLISKTSLLPPIVFILLFQFRLYNPATIACMLILLSISRLLKIASKETDDSHEVDFFAAGFMVGMATLTDMQSVIFLALIIIAIVIMGTVNKIRDMLTIFTGFLLPLTIWLFLEYAFNGNIDNLFSIIQPVSANFEIFKGNFTILEYAAIIFYVLLIIYSVGFVLKRLSSMNVAHRNKYTFFITIMFASLALVAIFNNPATFIILALPALSFLLSYVLANTKRIFANILFYVIAILPIIYLILLQYAPELF